MSASTIRPRTARTVDIIGVFAVVLGLVLGLVPGIAPGIADATHGAFGSTPGVNQFEIDGNITGHLDWEGAGGEQTADGTHTADSTWFKGGMFEYSYPNWKFVSGGNAPKSDLHRLFVASQVAGADSYLWLGATRLADNGSTQVTVEFNLADGATMDLASGYRVERDFYITWNFPGKPKPGDPTENVLVKIGSWPDGRSAGSYPTEVSLSSADFRYAIGGTTPGAFDFIELELDLAAIFGSGGLGLACGQFGAVSFRTESSGGGGGGTDESTLKDVAGPFAIDLDTCVDVDVNKLDADNNPLNGASFAAFAGLGAAAVGTAAATCITGPDATDIDGANTEEDGWCSLGAMLPGDYTLHEVAWDEDAEAWVSGAPEGYEAALDLPDDFTVGDVSLDLGPYTDPRIDYEIDVEADGRNAVGEPHTFTVTLTDVTNDTPVIGADIDLTWSGAADDVTSVTPAGPDPDTILDCTTDGDGKCTVIVSGSIGKDTLGASWTTPYQNASGDGGVATDDEAVASISDSADKTWVGYVASIEETATNLVSNGDTAGEHDFTVTVKEDDGSGTLTTPGASVEVTVTWTGAPEDAEITPADRTCDTDASGQCTFTVDSTTAGAGIITIVKLDGVILDVDGQSTTDIEDDSPTVEPGEDKSLSAVKTWREYRALIDGDATNPVGEPHTFHVQVQYRDDDNAASWADAEIKDLTVAWNNSGSAGSVDDAASTCNTGTDTDGHCTIVVDTEVDDPGSRKVELTSVTGDLLPDDVPSNTNLTYTFDDTQYDETENEFREATKTWIEFGANIVRDGRNLVSPDGESVLGEHTFTITVWRKPASGSDPTAVPAETKVTTSIDWDSDYDKPTDLVRDNNCLDDGTSNVTLPGGELASQCTITLNSTVAGEVTVTPTGLVGYDYGDGNGSQGVTFADGNTESAVKTWYRYRAWIDADSTNLAGNPEGDHDFTVTVEQDSGGGWGPVPNDTTVTVTSPDATNDGRLDDASCETSTSDGVSSCKIGVSSLLPGSRTVTVGTVETLAVENASTVDVSNGEYLDVNDPTQRTAATKTWVSYSATISADATNLTGQDHVFTVKAFVDSGDGPVAAPAGTTLTIGVDADFLSTNVADANTCDGDGTGNQTNPTTDQPAAANECFVTVSSDAVDKVTVTVTHVTPVAGTVDDDPTDDITDVEATKTWIEVRVDVSDDATNIVGESHAFDVTITVLSPDNPDGVAAPNGTTVTVSSTGVGRVVEDDETDPTTITGSTCDEGTTGGTGTCTVVVYSEASGDRSITVDSVTLGGTSFGAIDMDGTEGVASGNDLTGNKTWRAYRASIASDGLNLVRDQHPFTVTIEQTDAENPSEPDWTPVPEGTTAKVTLAGTGSIDSNDCDAPDGTSGDTGTCTVVVDSSSAGTATVTVSEIGVAHPDNPQATVTVNVTNDSATKTWVAFRGELSPDSLNITGDDHTFDVMVEYTTNGTDWDPVPDGSTVTYTNDGTTGSVTGDTCDPTTLENADQPDERVCTITVDTEVDDEAGTRSVRLTGVSAEITIGELTEDFDVSFPAAAIDKPSGVLDGFVLGDYAATKTWASYTLALTPVDALNLLNGENDDTERFHTITATLSSDADDASDAPVGGQEIAVSISGSTGVIVAVDNDEDVDVEDDSTFEGVVAPGGLSATCITADDGTCDIIIFSSKTGTAEVNASYQATVGDSDPVTVHADTNLEVEGIQGATKTWTTYRVTVTPVSATNLVGNDHVFTVRVERSTTDGDWLPVVGAVPTVNLSSITATITGNTCTLGTVANNPDTIDINEAGTCLVTVSSDNIEAVTLTATYQASVGQTTAAFSDQGDKTWIDYGIDVTPLTAENLVRTPHVFTVTVTTTFPTLDADDKPTTTTVPVVGAKPAVVLTGLGSITDTTCDDEAGTDTNGQCTVTISSAAAGSSTLTATYQGTAADDTEVRDYIDAGNKLWVDYALVIDPQVATNALGDEHEFTATLTVDTGQGFGPATGETLTFTLDGVGSVTGGDVDDALTCTTDEAGECDIVINSDETGTSAVGVSYDAVVGATSATFGDEGVKNWIAIDLVKTAVVGDGFSDGDLELDPDTGLPTLFFTSTGAQSKVAVYQYTITNTGPETLFNVELIDDRLGVIIDASEGLTLAPGVPTTVRANETFTYGDAAGGLDNIVVNTAVTTGQSEDGTRVSALDNAAIQLIAQQSSILIDLVKDVVVGEGDVDAADGIPTATWSQDEFEANASKVVRYSFTITNTGVSPIVDIVLNDPMISDQPILSIADGVTLQPGESTVVEVDHRLSANEAFPDGPTAGEVPNVATVRGANETRDSFDQDSDDAIVFVQVVFSETVLPVTGLDAEGLLPVSLLLIWMGAAVLWLNRRRGIIA